jgi:hypothetical protein
MKACDSAGVLLFRTHPLETTKKPESLRLTTAYENQQ